MNAICERRPGEKPISTHVNVLRIEIAGFICTGGHPRLTDGARWQLRDMCVIASTAIERDGREWLHLSVSRKGRLPSWDDMKFVKDTFAGEDALALQVFPPKAEFVNINPFVLHLWVCLTERVTPDFRIFSEEVPGGVGI